MKKKYTFLLLAFLAGFTSFSQSITNYTFTASGGSFTQLTGANFPALSSGDVNDGYFNNIPIGFDFWYMGTRTTSISASTNGWCTPGGNITNAASSNNIQNGGAPRPIFAPLWDNLDIQFASNVSYATTGTTGARIFTLEYLNAKWNKDASGNVISFQVKLYESTGKIEYVYRQEATIVKSPNATIGISGTATGGGNFLSLNNTGTNPTASSSSETNNLNAKPATGQTYSFLSPTPIAPSALVFSAVTATGMTLNWTDNSANEQGFVVYRSTDGTNFNFVHQTAANVTTYIPTGLLSNTTYYWRVYAVTEGCLSSALSGTKATLCTAPNISQIPTTTLFSSYPFNNNVSDAVGNNTATLQNNPTPTVDRFGIANSAYSFNGTNQYISTSTAYVNPTNFSLSTWFKTASVTGGKLIGFGSSQTGQSTNADRHIYMNNTGQIYFGVNPNTVVTVNSALSYNDNTWHLATATFSSTTGMALYVDGSLVGSNNVTTTAQNYTGYLRVGYDNTNGWTSQPSSSYFNGSLDDVLIYGRALTGAEVNTLFKSPDGAGNNGPVCSGSTMSLSATTLSGVTYLWSGPNGFTSTLQNPSFTYLASNAGTYTVQISSGGCASTAYTNIKSTSTTGQWTGAVSTDWSDVNNWCSGIMPTSLIDVTIQATAVRMPVITTSVFCKNIKIDTGASLITSLSGTLNVAGNILNNGTMTNSGTTVFNGTGAQQNFIGTTNFYNLTLNNSNGLILPAATTIGNNITFLSGNLNTNNFSVAVGGNWLNNAGTSAYTAGTTTAFFNGTAQTIGGAHITNFGDINITTATGTVTLTNNININRDLTITAGTLNIGAFTANRTVAGGILTINNNATLKIGGTNTYPANFTTNNLVVGSTVEYNGANQTVSNQQYGNLKLSSSGGAAVKTFPATTLTINGKLISTIGNGTSVSYTAAGNINIGDTVSIGTGTTFNGDSFTTNVAGAWINNGIFNGNTGSIVFSGAGKTVGGTGSQNFNNLTIAASLINFTNGNINVSGNLATTGPGSFTQISSGTLTMTGTAKTISGSGITIGNLAISGSITTASSFSISGDAGITGSLLATGGAINFIGTNKIISGAGSIGFYTFTISGSYTNSADFSVASAMIVGGSFTATAGNATFTNSSILSGSANLFNVIINGTALQLSANTVLGIANLFTISSGILNVSASTPNTVNFNGTTAQNINAISYHNLILSNGNTKTAAGNITVNNITIAAGTTFLGQGFLHSVYGNWQNSGTFTAGSGTVQFLGNQTQNITGATTYNNLIVNHTTAATGLILNSNIGASNIDMIQGNMLTGSNTVTITVTRTGAGIILGNIQRTHSFNSGVAYAFEGPENTITFSTVTGVSSITVSVVKGTITDFPQGSSINRQYTVAVPAGTYNATLRLHYEDDELNGNIESSMALWKHNGSSWNTNGKTGNNASSNFVEQSGLTNITDRWTLSDAINAVRWNGTVSSNWNTAANWTVLAGSATTPPSAGDIVDIGDTLFVNQPIISNSVTVKGIELSSIKAVNLSLTSGGSLTTGNINGHWSADAIHNINTNNQSLAINGDFNLSDGISNHIINLNNTAGSIVISGSLTQNSNAAITYNGAGSISVGGNYNYVSGNFNAGSGTFIYNGNTNQNIGAVTYNHFTVNKTGGLATINNPLTINGNLAVNSGELDNQNITTVVGNVTIAPGAVFLNSHILKVAGNWLNNGTFTGVGINIIFNGTGTQTISSSTFNNLEINKPANSLAILTGDVTLKGNLTGVSGTVDISNYYFDRDVVGGAASIGDSATLIIGSNNAPGKFSSYTLSSGSTIIFNGTDTQHLFFPGIVFGNLIFRNAGNKILYGPLTVMNKLLIEPTARFSAGANTINLYGNWENNGTFLPQTSTVLCAGTGKTISGITTFNRFTITGSYTILSNLTFNDKFTISSSGAATAAGNITTTLHGDLLNSGDLYSLGTTTFTGNAVQTLRLINAVRTVALTVNFNGTVSPVQISTSPPQFGFLNINNTGGVSPSVGWTVLYAMTVGAGATFNGGVSSHIINGSFINNGTVTSTGTISFLPATAATVNLGSDFSSTGRVYFGGAGAITILGTPVSLNNVNINNTNPAGISPASNWIITRTLRVIDGCIFNAGNYTHSVAGNILINGTLNKGGSTFILNGSTTQDIFCNSPFNNLTLNKTGDSTTITSNITIDGTLHFTAGKIFTNNFLVKVAAGGTVTGAAQNTGWIYGKLDKSIATGAPAISLEVGDLSYYSPLSLLFNTVTTSGSVTAFTVGSEHPNINTSSINAAKSLNRYWSLTNNGTVFNNYSATLNYIASDLDAGTLPTAIDVETYNGSSWVVPTTTVRHSTDITATGITELAFIAAGEICNKGTTIAYTGSPYCTSAGNATATVTGTAGGTFSAAAGLSINSSTGSVNLALSVPGIYTVTYTVAANGSCNEFITQTVIKVAIEGTWTGALSDDWNNAGNWACGGVPSTTTNVTVPAGLTIYPIINTTVSLNNITIQNSSSVIVNGTIKIAGTISNSGYFAAAEGTVEMIGNAIQEIPVDAFYNNAVNNLIINNNSVAGVSLAGTLDIYNSLTYSGTGKKLATNDGLTLKSSAAGTAWVGDMTGNSITGKVTVERYLSAHKAWRFLSVPTNTNQTFKDTWQEGGTNSTDNLSVGYGIQITSNRTTWAADGFDNSSAGPSIKTYNPVTNAYVGITGTNNPIKSTEGYMTFVRGDRTVINTATPPTSTTLRTTGTLYTHDQPAVPVMANQFTSIGNPFASAIDVRNLTKTGLKDFYYLWDPNMGGLYGFGGFQVLSKDVTNNYVITPGGGSFGAAGSINNLIQSGQAFFVQGDSVGGAVTFKENAKANGSILVSSASSTSNPPSSLRISLNSFNADNSPYVADGVFINFNDSYSNNVNNDDAIKSGNTNENLSIKQADKLLIIERRRPAISNDTIHLNFTNAKFQPYQFNINMVDVAQPGLIGLLEDSYLNTATVLNLSGNTLVNFTIQNIAGSNAANRFRIVFKTATVLPVTVTKIDAAKKDDGIMVSWTTTNETNVAKYEVEKSDDGIQFEKMFTKIAQNSNVNNYDWLDNKPFKNYNYYRIKIIYNTGEAAYTKIVKVLMAEETSISVYPNPVANGNIHLQFGNSVAGTYTLSLINSSGQLVGSFNINHLAGVREEMIVINPNIAAGLYRLKIVSNNSIPITIPISIVR